MLLPEVMDDIVTALRDVSDDVRAAAASALLPVVADSVEHLHGKVRLKKMTNFTLCLAASLS